MIPETVVWFIFLLPLASFVVIALVIRPFLNHRAELAGQITIAAVGASLLLSLWALGSVVNSEGGIVGENWDAHTWLTIGNFGFAVGILMDPADRHHAGGGHWSQPDGPGLLRGLHARRPGLCPLLRLHVAVHGLYDRGGAGQHHHPALRLLGGWWACAPTSLSAFGTTGPRPPRPPRRRSSSPGWATSASFWP